MNRIDPHAVAAWFRDHPGVRPIRSQYRWLEFVQPNSRATTLVGCCGLTSQLPPETSPGESLSVEYAGRVLGLGLKYAEGFLAGWDGGDHAGLAGGYEAGYADGRDAWALTREARP